MKNLSRLPRRDLERLSAYLDGELSERERARLESRLERDPQLREAYHDLRATSHLLAALPEVGLPRSYTLTADMVGLRRRGGAYPALRLATALATLVFVVLVGLDALTPSLLPMARAPEAAAPMAVEEAPSGENALDWAQEAPVEGEQEVQPLYSAPSAVGGEVPPLPEAEVQAERAAEASDRAALTPCPTCTEEALAAAASKMEGEAEEHPEEVVEEGAPVEAVETAKPEATATPAPTPTLRSPPEDFSEGVAGGVPLLRLLEIGFGAATLLLAALTLWVRQRG